MNEILELWSVPWHALQRNLAEAFGAQAASTPAAPDPVSVRGPAVRAAAKPDAANEPVSWLVRAHLRLRHTI